MRVMGWEKTNDRSKKPENRAWESGPIDVVSQVCGDQSVTLSSNLIEWKCRIETESKRCSRAEEEEMSVMATKEQRKCWNQIPSVSLFDPSEKKRMKRMLMIPKKTMMTTMTMMMKNTLASVSEIRTTLKDVSFV